MKKSHFFIYPVCFFLLALCGCEGTSDHTTVPGTFSNEQINERTEDCEECPVDYCCCLLELRAGEDYAKIHLCGLSDGTFACGPYDPPGSCEDFSGAGQEPELFDFGPTGVAVCVEKNGVVRIQNTSGEAVQVRFTCQHDVINPQWVNLSLANGEVVFLTTNGSCTLSAC
jgi:hypothetical protein